MYTCYLDNISDFESNDISQSIFYRYENTMEQSRLKWSQYYILSKNSSSLKGNEWKTGKVVKSLQETISAFWNRSDF